MTGEIRMNIQLCINTQNTDNVLEEGMERISQISQDKLQWKKHKIYNCYETECNIPAEDIIPIFDELITKYTSLDISASYSCDIREDDHSAQWWSTTVIRTEHHPDGTATLITNSTTNWF